jgi:hypothetical protein
VSVIAGHFPKNYGLPGFRFSRSYLLNGSIHCCYGPGQPPHCLDSSGYAKPIAPSTQALPATFSYLKPTDWMGAGTLLRVPQVVHVSVTVPWYSATSRADPNPVVSGYANEYLRIKNQLDSLVTTINTLRPGRTWASRVNWISVPSAEEPASDGADSNAPNFSYGNRYLHMLPIPANSSFFGTNYLSIWVGTISWDVKSSPSPPDYATRLIGYSYTYFSGGIWNQVHILNDTVVGGTPNYQANCRPCVTTNYSKFAKFATWLYGMNIDWAVGSGVQMPLWSNQALFDTADDLAGYGFEYKGDNSLISAASLLPLIAAHFGFNPTTGHDL